MYGNPTNGELRQCKLTLIAQIPTCERREREPLFEKKRGLEVAAIASANFQAVEALGVWDARGQPRSNARVRDDECRKGIWIHFALLMVAFSMAPSLVFAQSFDGQGTSAFVGGPTASTRPGFFVDTTARTAAGVYPSLAGSYTSSAQHPRVFMTPNDLSDMVTRINPPGSFSAQSFARLSNKVKADLAANVDWDAVYSGCDLDIYLHAFSYEPVTGYADEIRTTSQLGSAMHVKAGMAPPTGAAIVASRLAIYAALVKSGAKEPTGGPSSGEAAALAKRILLAWANRGFRDQGGNALSRAEQFCDGQQHFNAVVQGGVGLQVGRGIVYSVHAQDLLQSIGAFNSAQTNQLNVFHAAIFNLIREASNFRAAMPQMKGPNSPCDRYSNHVGAHLLGLLAIARLLDDGRRFNAVLYGNDRSLPVTIPWTEWFNHAVYGENDKPISCHKNTGPDSLTSHPSFQTAVVAPGEIEDRYRNANPGQAFGYALGVLAGLYEMSDLMKNAGFDALTYRGTHHQSIEMATQYYACYGKNPGFKKTVTADNARACPDYQQYVGQIVNGLEPDIVIGAYRFPGNSVITELEPAAKTAAGPDVLDAIRFGRWRD